MIQTAILGATGYTGLELVRLLARHPHVAIRAATSASHAGRSLAEVADGAPDLPLVGTDGVPWDQVDLVLLCLPHAASAPLAVRALDAGARVIDLSADFRLKDAFVYEHWYGLPHPAPDLLDEAVYGLTEINRAAVRSARLVANPGCYPTSVLLALYPLARAGLIAAGHRPAPAGAAGANLDGASSGGPIIVDAKSGVTGAGRSAKVELLFAEVAGSFRPYAIGRSHRHLPEMVQALAGWTGAPPDLIFSPHLLPVPRGILSTIYVPLPPGDRRPDPADVRRLYEEAYADEPFVQLLPAGRLPSLAQVTHTNRCVLGLTPTEGTLIATAAIDNLGKGAAGQAVQNLNVMFGLPESAGLE